MFIQEGTLIFITYFLTVCIGYLNVIIGLIGNLMNILVFTQLKIFRRNQAAFYLTAESIADSFHLIFPMAADITAAAFGFDPTKTSMIWCKLAAYSCRLTRIISIYSICVATIDQYLSTSSNIRLRQMSTFESAPFLTGILIVSSLVYSIPFLIFYEIRPNFDCATFNPTFNYFYSFFHYCILVGILPIIISWLFGILAYRNVRRIIRHQVTIIRRRLDRQLTAMILIRVGLLSITALPYISFRIYQVNYPIFHDHTYYLSLIDSINAILISIYNVHFAGSFYVFLMLTSRFRRQVKYIFRRKILRKRMSVRTGRNQVAPETQIPTIAYNESRKPAHQQSRLSESIDADAISDTEGL